MYFVLLPCAVKMITLVNYSTVVACAIYGVQYASKMHSTKSRVTGHGVARLTEATPRGSTQKDAKYVMVRE
jgi:hypothetical protein